MRAMVLLLAAAALGCEAQIPAESSDITDDEAAIRAVVSGMNSTWNAGDLAGNLDYVDEGAVQVSSGEEPIGEGKAVLAALWEDYAERFDSEMHTTMQHIWVSGDLAVAYGTSSITESPRAGGEATQTTSNVMWAFRRGPDGRWLYLASN